MADHRTLLEGLAIKREECTPGTRVKILAEITAWANDRSSNSPCVFALTGQAGSGKSTIAYTITRRFDDNTNTEGVSLGGNFLCSRQFEETRKKTSIIPTLVYQLARKCIPYADALHLADKFEAAAQDIATQMMDLLVQPWNSGEDKRPPYLIVIDAIDEIWDRGGIEFLRELLRTVENQDLRGFKFLITSRSDPEVITLCESFVSGAICRLQDVPIEEAASDIEKYLKAHLPELADDPNLAELGRRAGGLFIYAATAVKYLTPCHSVTGREQAELLDKFLVASSKNSTSLIDGFYQQILHEAFYRLEENILRRRISYLYTCLCTIERTSAKTIAALVPNGDEKGAEAVLSDLHAVLYTQNNQVFWYHSSFPDFIFTKARSNFTLNGKGLVLWCDEPMHQKLLAESCFDIMKRGLYFNMGNIKSSFLRDSEIREDLSEQIDQNISDVLIYSCRYWADHLPPPNLVDTASLCRRLSEFLDNRVLFWIEVLNLLRLPNMCNATLQRVRLWVLKV